MKRDFLRAILWYAAWLGLPLMAAALAGVNKGYLEVARFVTTEIQIAAQLQAMRSHAPRVPDGSQLLWHESAALGLNYWFTPGMVMKAALEGVRGNRLAFPRLLDDALLSGGLHQETLLFTVGTQFSF